MSAVGSSRSRLVPVGFVLMVVGIAFPRALSTLLASLDPGPARLAVNTIIVVLYAAFLAGLVLAVVGILRNRRMHRG